MTLAMRTGVFRRLRGEELGATSIVVVLLMTVLMACGALVIDVGAVQAHKARLQDAADAAALAIAQECFESTATSLAACADSVIGDAGATAIDLAAANLSDDDLEVAGIQFTSDTVQVRLTSSQHGFFGGAFAVDGADLSAQATASWSQQATPLPLAMNECVLPDSVTGTVQFLRWDLLSLDLAECGILGGVLDALGAAWLTDWDCELDSGLPPYIVSTLSKALPTYCYGLMEDLIGRQVLLPVYDSALGDVVIDGALLNDFEVEGWVLFEVTGYDFEILDVNLFGVITATAGIADMPATGPRCPSIDILGISIEVPTCQGIQGIFHGILTDAEAEQLLVGVQLIE